MVQTLKDYQAQTHETAIYPTEHALGYLTMGLANEFSEYGNAPTRELALAELGDICWFLSELANLTNTSLSVLHATPIVPEEDSVYTWSVPSGDGYAIAILTQELLEFQGYAAKHLRDGFNYYTQAEVFLHRSILTVDSVCDIMGVTLESILSANLKKLQDRKSRGKLGGSGDKR